MSNRKWHALFVPAALLASATAVADPARSLSDVPVVAAKVVAPADYAAATALAARGGIPVAIALEIAGPFEGTEQQIVQVNEGGEALTASRITILRDGLHDDSLRGERWDITLARNSEDVWKIVEVKKAWRCRRGENTERFVATRCP